jgi:hypothetical protein
MLMRAIEWRTWADLYHEHSLGHCALLGLAGTAGHRDPGASGSVSRLLGPDSVRYMSVTIAMQGRTAAHRETQRDSGKAACEPGNAQAKRRFRRWWQVLGSNQRRLSRRFYRALPGTTAHMH